MTRSDPDGATQQPESMLFDEAIASGAFPVSLEILPPRTPKPAVLMRRARLLEAHSHIVNVIQRPGRQSSLDAALELRRAGLEPVWHLTTSGRTRESIEADVARAQAGGITHVLCLQGAHAPPTPGSSVRGTIRLVREQAPGMDVGAALNQHDNDPRARRNLMAKLHAGVSHIWTEPVFDLEALLQAADVVKTERPEVRVIAMAMPLLTPESFDALSERVHVPVPDDLHKRIEMGEEEAWRVFGDILAALAQEDLIDGVAIMTYRADPSPDTGPRILAELQRAGIATVASATAGQRTAEGR